MLGGAYAGCKAIRDFTQANYKVEERWRYSDKRDAFDCLIYDGDKRPVLAAPARRPAVVSGDVFSGRVRGHSLRARKRFAPPCALTMRPRMSKRACAGCACPNRKNATLGGHLLPHPPQGGIDGNGEYFTTKHFGDDGKMSESCNHDCGSCSADCASRTESFRAEQNEHSNVKKVIGVVSGKGGVGKSLVTSLLAVSARRRGYETAILDADITGPSIPKAFNVHTQLMGTGRRRHRPPRAGRASASSASTCFWKTRRIPSSGAARSSPARSSSSGRTSCGATWTTCSST